MTQPETITFRRRNLPHWYVANRPYFVTFRLKGTLPLSVVREYEQAMDDLIKAGANLSRIGSLQREYFNKIESILDSPRHSIQHLKDERVGTLVMNGLQWLEVEKGWRIYAAVVMSNHVHCCLQSTNGRSAHLADDIGSVKKFTARRVNEMLKRSGQFWQNENFDHWCRSSSKVDGSIQYIRNNPVKAGLVRRPEDWPWVIIDDDMLSK